MIVLDASVLLEVLLRLPDSDRIERRILSGNDSLHAPHLVDVEIVQVVRRYVRRGDIPAERGEQALSLLAQFPMTRYVHTPLLSRIWTLRDNLTAYDAAYVSLAEALGARLVTRDAALASVPGCRAKVEVL